MRAIRWLDAHFEETLLAVLLVLIACVELMQVIFRNISALPTLTWAEEFCRFCWIWSVFLSLPYTVRKGSMLRVTVLADALPENLGNILDILTELITAGAMLLLGVHATGVVNAVKTSGETSPAMLWPMWAVYFAMLPGFFLTVLRCFQQTALRLRRMYRKERGD